MYQTRGKNYGILIKDYPDIMDVDTMCQMLGISTKTGYKLLKSKTITALKVGRAYRIPKQHVLSYLKMISAA